MAEPAGLAYGVVVKMSREVAMHSANVDIAKAEAHIADLVAGLRENRASLAADEVKHQVVIATMAKAFIDSPWDRAWMAVLIAVAVDRLEKLEAKP